MEKYGWHGDLSAERRVFMKKVMAPVEYAVFRKTGPGWQIPERTIPNHELVFVTRGRGWIVLAGREQPVGEGDLIYFRPGRLHSLRTNSEDPMEFYGIHISLPEGMDALDLPEFSHRGFSEELPYLRETVRLWRRKDYLDDWEADLAFSRLLLHLSRRMEIAGSPCQRKVAAAIAFIHANTGRALAMEEICAVSGMKKSCLTRSFQRAVGIPPVAYSIRTRLERAKVLLANEGRSVRETAQMCGFLDEFYFSRMFRKQFGCSPTEFRETV